MSMGTDTDTQSNDLNSNLNNNNRLRLKVSSLRTNSEINQPPNQHIYRNRTPSLTEIQKHLIKSNNMLNSPHPPPPPPTTTITNSTTNTTKQTHQETQPQLPSQDLHPLQHSWTLYFDSRAPKRLSTISGASGGLQAYEAGLQTIGTFNSVEQFSRFFNWTVIPSRMEMNSSVQLFKANIKPMWEDPANSNGGKWTLTMKSNSNTSLLDKLWTYLVLGLVGEQIENDLSATNSDQNNDGDEDFICGAVVATRPKGNRIQVWVKEKDNTEKINSFGKRLMQVLELDDHSAVTVEFSGHQNPSGSHIRGGGGSSHNTPLRPTLGGGSMISGSVMRGIEEKMMGGAGGSIMRRSTSMEVGQLGLGRINSSIGMNNSNNHHFPSLGGGMYRGGLAGPAHNASLNSRTGQLSSLDPPIQNGVWRPSSNPPCSESTIRAAGLPTSMTNSFMNQFNNNHTLNRRHQSSQNLTTLGSMTGGHNNPSFKSNSTMLKPSPLGPLPPGLQDSHHLRQLSSGSSTCHLSSPSPSRNPSPAPPTGHPFGVGILSGS